MEVVMRNVLKGTLLALFLAFGVGCGGDTATKGGKAPPPVDMEKKKDEMMKMREKTGGAPTGPGGEADKGKEKEKDKSKNGAKDDKE
jgi:hypothetical protein